MAAASEEEYAAHIERLSPSALVCHFGPVGFSGLVPGLACGVPVITIFHGYDVSMLLRDTAWVERYQALFQFGGHAVCISHEGRRRLLAIGCSDDKATAIHLGVDLDRFAFQARQPRRPIDTMRLLVVARLAEKKGLPVVLRAVRRVIDRGLHVSLRIVGEGEERASLLALRAALGLERAVTFVGPLDGDGVRRELASCDALALTSLTAADGDQEGIPVVLMEAMASGVPVIASRHSGIPELVAHNRTGLLVPEGDDLATADAIARLTANGPLGRRLAVGARAHIEEEFNLQRQGARFGALIGRVVRQHARNQPPAPSAPSPSGERLLLLRSAPVPVALSKLVVLRHRYPSTEIAVLTRDDTREVFDRCPLVSEVFTVPAGRMSLASVPPATLAAVRAGGFARVLVPLGDDPHGYDNVWRVAHACGAPVVVGLTASNHEVPAHDERAPAS